MGSGRPDGAAPHVIRLRGPWESTTAHGAESRVKLPCAWVDAVGDAVEVRLARRFNRPTSLAERDRVVLRMESHHTLLAAQLNAAPLEFVDSAADVTTLLTPSNLLTVTLQQGPAAALVLEAQLEIVSR